MTVAQYCLLAAIFMPIGCAGIAKAGAFGWHENRQPRAWLANQTGWRARANAAQANSFEALPLFLAGLLVASQNHAAQHTVDTLAAAFVLLRILYVGLYLADFAKLRSLVWAGAVACVVSLFFSGS